MALPAIHRRAEDVMPCLFAAAGPEPWQQVLGLAVIALAVFAIARQMEVRLILVLTALALASLAGNLPVVFKTFFATFADERFVVPICTAMGFSYVLRLTGCDQHLVHLLVRPLTKVRPLLIPGTVLVGYAVNMPVVSQTSTAATIGPVVIPILRAANVSPTTAAAALLLGSSIGGELLNPGAPELRATVEASKRAAREYNEGHPDAPVDPAQFNTQRGVGRILPLSLVALAIATGTFWLTSRGHERRHAEAAKAEQAADDETAFRINPVKALVPLLPLAFLYLTMPPLQLVEVPHDWLEQAGAPPGRFDSRLVGAAMLLGAAVAALVTPRKSLETVGAFCTGAGYAYTHIISLIVAARCFGAAIDEIGFADAVAGLILDQPLLMYLTAWLLPLAFALRAARAWRPRKASSGSSRSRP
jgi:DcuC family C4-dicarboxylate transporter